MGGEEWGEYEAMQTLLLKIDLQLSRHRLCQVIGSETSSVFHWPDRLPRPCLRERDAPIVHRHIEKYHEYTKSPYQSVKSSDFLPVEISHQVRLARVCTFLFFLETSLLVVRF